MARVARLRAPVRRAGTSQPPASRARRPRPPQRRQAALHRQHPLHQHHPASRTAAVPRQPRDRAPHQEPRPLERAGDGGQGQQGGRRDRRSHLDVRVGGHALRSRVQPLLQGQGRRPRRRHHLLPGTRGAGHLRARVPRRTPVGREARELPPRAEAGRRPLVVSASVADARLLGVPDGVDGPRSDLLDLPGALHALPGGSRAEEAVELEGVGVPRRRRDRRARNARRDHARLAREARQPDLRHQLQPAAARRSGARQRSDHPGARGDLPRRRLERHQGDLGQRVGCAAREGPRRPARQAHGRGRRRRVSEVRRRVRRLRPQALLGRRSAAARDGQAPVGRAAEEADARRPRPDQGLRGLQGGRRAHRASRPSSWRARSRATASARRARARTSPTSRRS